MKRPIMYRIQDWAADRFDSVQYPPMRPPRRRLFVFEYQMPLVQRIFIAISCSIIIVISLCLLAWLLFWAWIFIFA